MPPLLTRATSASSTLSASLPNSGAPSSPSPPTSARRCGGFRRCRSSSASLRWRAAASASASPTSFSLRSPPPPAFASAAPRARASICDWQLILASCHFRHVLESSDRWASKQWMASMVYGVRKRHHFAISSAHAEEREYAGTVKTGGVGGGPPSPPPPPRRRGRATANVTKRGNGGNEGPSNVSSLSPECIRGVTTSVRENRHEAMATETETKKKRSAIIDAKGKYRQPESTANRRPPSPLFCLCCSWRCEMPTNTHERAPIATS